MKYFIALGALALAQPAFAHHSEVVVESKAIDAQTIVTVVITLVVVKVLLGPRTYRY